MEFLGLDSFQIVERLGFGLIVGGCIGLTGVGGGVLVLPILTVFLRMNAVMAVGTASLYSFLTRIFATFCHSRLKTIQWRLCLFFLAGALPVNLIVSRWVSGQGESQAFAASLQWFITGVVIFCVSVTFCNLINQILSHRTGIKRRSLSERIACRPLLRRILGVAMGALVGGLIGATSIGGGVMIIPILIIFFGLSASQTVGSSIFISLVLALINSVNYFFGENSMDLATAVIMAVGSIAGVPLGSRLSVEMSDKLLQSVVVLLISIAAALMFVNSIMH